MSLQVPHRQANGTGGTSTKAVILVSLIATSKLYLLTIPTGRRPFKRHKVQATFTRRAEGQKSCIR